MYPAVARVTAHHWAVCMVILVYLIAHRTVATLCEIAGAHLTQSVDEATINILGKKILYIVSLEPGRLGKGAWKGLHAHAPKFPENLDTVVNLLVITT